jgi:tetratricopeptide (TPR) repeat protein
VNDEQIRALLQRTDETADAPRFGPVTAAGIRGQARRRQLVKAGVPLAVAASVLIAVVLWTLCLRTGEPLPQPQRIASLEEQVRQLQAQTETTLKLVQEVLEKDRQDRRLAALQAELASIPDPVKEIDRQVDKAAFILVYQADKLYKELNQTESAVAAYKEVIQLFPTNQWADVARERLSQIEQRRMNRSDSQKGAARCEPRNA